MIYYSSKNVLTAEETDWYDALLDKQDRLYFGSLLVDQFGMHLAYTKFFLAHNKQGEVIAALEAKFLSGVVSIYLVIVEDNYRRQSIGEQLVRQCEEHAKETGSFYIWLETRREWEAAYKLYEKLDYQVTQELETYYFGLPWIRMGKKLTNSKA